MEHDARRRLEDLLDREIEVARSLAATLAAEKTALIGDVPKAVEQAAADKIQLLTAIEKLETERRSLGHSPEAKAGVLTVAERWRALLEVLAGCRSANEVNGRIIHIRQNQIRQLIDIVRGGPSITYGPQGQTYGKALRALAQA